MNLGVTFLSFGTTKHPGLADMFYLLLLLQHLTQWSSIVDHKWFLKWIDIEHSYTLVFKNIYHILSPYIKDTLGPWDPFCLTSLVIWVQSLEPIVKEYNKIQKGVFWPLSPHICLHAHTHIHTHILKHLKIISNIIIEVIFLQRKHFEHIKPTISFKIKFLCNCRHNWYTV